MKDRPAFDLKKPLAAWNLFLAVFSFIGAARVLPHLFMILWEYGLEYTSCRAPGRSYGSGPSGLWVCAFIFSKYFELIDTVFLVLRKKPVNFLHWYHHCTVLLYCWHSYMWQISTGIYFAAMNYTVHAIMYFYYYLAAVGKPPKWSLFVTTIQLSQMGVGIAVVVYHSTALLAGTIPHCDGHVPNNVAALVMYASYFFLFAQFLVERYCCGKRASAKKDKKAVKSE